MWLAEICHHRNECQLCINFEDIVLDLPSMVLSKYDKRAHFVISKLKKKM